jgi:ABC-2 type transport system permease protein
VPGWWIGLRVTAEDRNATGLRWFADNQPFASIVERLRGLLPGTATGRRPVTAIVWSAGIVLVGYLWSRRLFNHDPIRQRPVSYPLSPSRHP